MFPFSFFHHLLAEILQAWTAQSKQSEEMRTKKKNPNLLIFFRMT